VHRTSLLYVDPPYDVDRSSSYAVDMTDADHAELIGAALAADAAVVVSGYAGGLWDHRLTDAGWYRHEITAATSQSGALQQRTEVVWSNRVSSHGAPVRDETQAAPTRCPACTAIIRQPRTGRRRRWCSVACRNVGYRAQRT
jgi:DNA adenine methylase